MIVISIITLLASIAVPQILRSRRRSQASRILEDLRMLDNALEQYAIEKNKTSGTVADFQDLKSYVKTSTQLYNTGSDLLGNEYGPFTVGTAPKVTASAYESLSDVAPPEFWSPYK